MGNLCSKSSSQSDPFSRPGHVLGGPNQPSPPVPVPGHQHQRTPPAAEGAAAKAAEAAEGRAKMPNQGRLAKELAAQKSQTRVQTLTEASRVEIDARRADSLKISRWD
ncbi:hypothetical protein V8E54_014295 [Elaphomyces granulatus]